MTAAAHRDFEPSFARELYRFDYVAVTRGRNDDVGITLRAKLIPIAFPERPVLRMLAADHFAVYATAQVSNVHLTAPRDLYLPAGQNNTVLCRVIAVAPCSEVLAPGFGM